MNQAVLHIGSLNRLRPEFEERYIILHKHTFPEVLRRIRKSNIRDYSIFLLDGILFSHFEYVGKIFANDMVAIGSDKVTQEWWKLTDPMQDPFPARKEGEWWATMELVGEDRRPRITRKELRRVCYTAEANVDASNVLKDIFGKEVQRNGRPHGPASPKWSVFFGLNRVCIYFEYPTRRGTDNSVDPTSFVVGAKSRVILEKVLSSPWRPMKEVFHTE